MDNIAYEEFPKLSNEGDAVSEDRGRENDGALEGEDGRRNLMPPFYASATEPTYPEEPPPAYTITSAFELPSYSMPQFQPYVTIDPTTNQQHGIHGHFGVIIDRTSLPPPIVVTEPPADFLPLSIFNLIFCCLLFGVFAIVKSIATRAAIQMGDYNLAYMHSMEARNWNIAAIITGAIIWTLLIVSVVVLSTV